jgi:hypothetical protein
MSTTFDLISSLGTGRAGIAEEAARLARALRRWVGDLRRPLTRDEVARRIAIQREAQHAMTRHGHAYHGQFVTMRQRLELR